MKYNHTEVTQDLIQYIIQAYPDIDVITLHKAVESLYISTADFWAQHDKSENNRLYARQQAKVVYENVFQTFS